VSSGASTVQDRGAMRIAYALAIAVLTSCASSAQQTERLELRTLNASGVTGTVTLTAIDGSRTRVEVAVDPAGHPNMPAHIHPGTCDALVPQPIYPLESVVDGVSVTEVLAPLDELIAGGVALNIHDSNEDMGTYTACVELGPG
jgi:hypothetical protein